MNPTLTEKIEGLLLGTAVADSIGLPMEGMRPAKIRKLGWADQKSLKHRLFFGRGMWSDDTEQTIMIAQSLLACEGDERRFTRLFGSELRWWLLGMPAATGLATARAILKLWIGFSPQKSGVFSAGNGAAMRTAPIAAFFLNDPARRKAFTVAQTRVTHSDPKAAIGALAVVELIALFLKSDATPAPEAVLKTLYAISKDSEWRNIVQLLETDLREKVGIQELLPKLGGNPEKGVSGYVYQTVPAVILSGIRNDWDFLSTVSEIIAAGGDTDTTAAIAGALCGACGGVNRIPKVWIAGVKEWPTSLQQLRSLAQALTDRQPMRVRRKWSPMLLLRNLMFLTVVLFHGFARLVR